MSPMTRIIGLVIAGTLVVVAGMLVPDYFLTIPWPIRWWMGEVGVIALVCAAYWWAARTSPPRPWRLADGGSAPAPDRLLAVALQAVTLSFAYPLFARPGWGSIFDWDLHFSWFEGIRQSVLRWHQFPWWDPWRCGGFPLAAEPQVGLVSLDTPLVLLFGTATGLRLAAVASLMLAVEGARRLARAWLADPWAAAIAAAIYGWNGAIVLFTVCGHALTICHPFLPWMLLFAFRIDRGPRPAALLGVTAAASVLTVIQYPTAYGMLITAAVLAWGFFARPRPDRARYLALIGLAVGVFLALAGWRLLLSGSLLAEFPKKVPFTVNNSPWTLVHTLLDRFVPEVRGHPLEPFWSCEMASYVGLVPVLAAVLSLRREWRWWNTLMFTCFGMALGSARVIHPSYWASYWPVFSAMHNVGRWKFPALLGLGLAAGSEVQAWRAAPGLRRSLATALSLAVLCDLALYAHQCLPAAFDTPPTQHHGPEPPVSRIVTLKEWRVGGTYQCYEAIRNGYGVLIIGASPILAYSTDGATVRLWRGHPDYRGEFVSGGRPVEPAAWSPNRVEFRLAPGQEVEVNQNPSSYWWANGRRLFPGARCAELKGKFTARADGSGRLVLEASPPGLRLAAGVTLAGLVLAAACLRLSRSAGGTGPGAGSAAR